MSLGGRGRGEGLKVALDIISITLIAVELLTVLFGGLGGLNNGNQGAFNLGSFLIEFEAIGILGALITRSWVLDVGFTGASINKEYLYVAANLAGFFLLNLVVPPTVPLFLRQSVAPTPNFGTIIIGVPEETVFRGWLAPWLANVSRTGTIGGTLGSAFLFTLYHLFVDGTSPSKLIVVFGAGLISGFTVLKTRHLSITMAGHILNNGVSVYGI